MLRSGFHDQVLCSEGLPSQHFLLIRPFFAHPSLFFLAIGAFVIGSEKVAPRP